MFSEHDFCGRKLFFGPTSDFEITLKTAFFKIFLCARNHTSVNKNYVPRPLHNRHLPYYYCKVVSVHPFGVNSFSWEPEFNCELCFIIYGILDFFSLWEKLYCTNPEAFQHVGNLTVVYSKSKHSHTATTSEEKKEH